MPEKQSGAFVLNRDGASASSLEAMEGPPQWDSLESYVKSHGGSRVISRILIANNGIAAVKCIRSMRKWAYAELGIESALTFISMATPEDISANAEFVRLADEVVQVPGGANNNNYANVDLIVDLAERKQVDAVWAGWGHASENPQLPSRLSKTKRQIVFLGPGAKAMHDLGDKVGSSIIAQSANVPCIEWSGSHVRLPEESILARAPHIPHETYLKACVSTPEEALASAEKVGYPLMVKASEGGGGKGIRKVTCKEDLPTALFQVQSEVVGSPVFLMKLFSGGRHIEVQVLADQHGNVITLHGRDCSIQRRHQKIIEEGPPIAADPEAFKRMEAAAASLAKAVGYQGVGTVEYLYRDNQFFFLEMNPRLQVEHTVTEMINDFNLPVAMLLVGMGIPLSRVPDVRSLYSMPSRHGSSPIDFDTAKRGEPKRYVIAARITAENPTAGFRPTSGVVQELNFRNSPHVWGYFSVFGRGAVHEFSDSQFGHIFASGGTRESARKHLVLALKEMSVYGEIRTTLNYLAKMLELDDYKNNNISTEWLDKLLAEKTISLESTGGPMRFVNIVCGAVVKANAALSQLRVEAVTALEYGRVPPASLMCTHFPVELVFDGVKYCIQVTCVDRSMFALQMNGSVVYADTRLLSDDRLLVFVDGKTHTVFTRDEASGLRMQINGQTVIFEREDDPTKLKASTTGKLVRFLVDNGAHCPPGTAYADMEVMKMYMQLTTTHAGKVWHAANPDSYIKAGDVVANVELDDSSSVNTAETFNDKFPDFVAPHLPPWRCHQHLREAVRRAEAVLAGFSDPAYKGEDLQADIVRQLFECLKDPALPYLEMQEAFNTVKAALPSALIENIGSTIQDNLCPLLMSPQLHSQGSPKTQAPATAPLGRNMSVLSLDEETPYEVQQRKLLQCCKELLDTLAPLEGDPRLQLLLDVVRRHAGGQQAFMWDLVSNLLEKYVCVEGKFSGMLDRREEVITTYVKSETTTASLDAKLSAREARQLACGQVYEALVANEGIRAASSMVVCILAQMQHEAGTMPSRLTAPDPKEAAAAPPMSRRLLTVLHDIEELRGGPYAKVAVEARQLLMNITTPSIADRQKALYQDISEAVREWESSGEGEIVKGYRSMGKCLANLTSSVHSIFEELAAFMRMDQPQAMRFASLELFLRRSHRHYTIQGLNISDDCLDSGEEVGVLEMWFQRQSHTTIMNSKILSSHGSDEDLERTNVQLRHLFEASGGLSPKGALEQNLSKGRGLVKKIRRHDSSFVGGSFTDSILDMQNLVDDAMENVTYVEPEYPWRYLVMVVFNNIETLEKKLMSTLQRRYQPQESAPADTGSSVSLIQEESTLSECVHVLNIALHINGNGFNDQVVHERFSKYVQQHKGFLRSLNISRVTFIVLRQSGYPGFYTFRESVDYGEDLIYRHLNPPRAFQIEIGRLGAHYDIKPIADAPVLNRHIRAFLATQKTTKSAKGAMTRFFVRALVHGRVLQDEEDCRSFIRHEVERMLQECCDSLALSKGFVEKQTGRAVAYNHFGTLQMCNHLFLAIVPQLHLSRFEVIELLEAMVEKNQSRLRQVGVIEVEIPINVVEPEDDEEGTLIERTTNEIKRDANQMRVILCNPSGHKVQTNAYLEVLTSAGDLKCGTGFRYKAFVGEGLKVGPLDGKDVLAPYPPMDQLELKRLMAKGKETTYVYDMITLFEKAIASGWDAYDKKVAGPENFISKLSLWPRPAQRRNSGSGLNTNFSARELVLDDAGHKLVEVTRPAGQNDVAMIVWRVFMRTPECPGGREFILVANDSTLQNGSFGVREDEVFLLATQMAQAEGLPRIYIAANTGARIGLVEEVKQKFRVQWNDSLNPSSGMDFLYLDETTVDVLTQQGYAATEEVVAKDGTKRHKITAAIGDGIGVENLQGSGKIAGITSRAYNDIFTLTFVSGTSVGIGAYLVRLGQRAIQKGPPILLTGEAALNKVLGKAVYTSNYQLGGTQIMFANGVSHETVDNDLKGVEAIVRWLAYVPAKKGGPLPVLRMPNKKLMDPIDRKVYDPRRGPNPEAVYDPRLLLTGCMDAIGKWRGGMFDDGSFSETLAGWGMTTICGRARLGGIPMGVILPEMRTVSVTHPADPADPDSKEMTSQQAGLVWFPDSSYKTATAIRDFNHEGLPLMILANWRGFSGGMRDMYEQILKFGSMIVDSLVEYKQPVFVYIPPNGELRGGAWVVIDQTINPDVMEMFVDPTARGGILEPSGIVEIKYRRHQILETMARLDPEIAALNIRLANAGEQERSKIATDLKKRQELLLPLYSKVAEHFADLHDVPARMMAKGCISGIVDWKWSRQFFYGRLRRRLAEFAVIQRMAAAEPEGTRDSHKSMLNGLIKKQVKDQKRRLPSYQDMGQHIETGTNKSASEADKEVAATIERDHRIADLLKNEAQGPVNAMIAELMKRRVRQTVKDMVGRDEEASLEGFMMAVGGMSIDTKQALLKKLMEGISHTWAQQGSSIFSPDLNAQDRPESLKPPHIPP